MRCEAEIFRGRGRHLGFVVFGEWDALLPVATRSGGECCRIVPILKILDAKLGHRL